MLDLHLIPFPELRTARLKMVRMTVGHAGEIFRLRSNAQAMRFIGKSLLRSAEEAERLIDAYTKNVNENTGITWGITLKETNRLIGTIGYHTIDKSNHRAEIGYMIHPDYWGQGIMSEAVGCVIDFGFHSLYFHSIEAKVNPENVSSARLLVKFGFTQEAYFKESFYFENRFHDMAVYSLVAKK